MWLRGLREPKKNEREQGIICRMIESLIKITSQDQMASREGGEYLCILIGHRSSGKIFGGAASFSRPAPCRRGWCGKRSHRALTTGLRNAEAPSRRPKPHMAGWAWLLHCALEGLSPQEQTLRHGFNSK